MQRLFIDIVKSTEHEILLIIPTTNSFLREQRLGIIPLLKDGVAERGINVKILAPINDDVLQITQSIEEEIGEQAKKRFHLRAVDVPYQESTVNTVTIIIVDKKASLVIEKLDDSKEDFLDAIGLATHSNSKPTVSSYISIFESLWNQTKLYEELRRHDKMQREFINIAAHELRTPAQSILGYAELVRADLHKNQVQSFIDVIYRNALRIHKLTRDILDVSRIESQTLSLNKIKFNLKEVIISCIEDVRVKLVPESSNNKIKVAYKTVKGVGEEEEDGNHGDNVFVEADRDRITQVISNLLDNAIKFTPQGLVSIAVSGAEEENEGQEEENEKEVVVVSVQDTGLGIDPEIFPRLFTKFSSRSFSGTGLGLYVSKSIIEAHGGKIWAKNNNDKGATFCFSLPLAI